MDHEETGTPRRYGRGRRLTARAEFLAGAAALTAAPFLCAARRTSDHVHGPNGLHIATNVPFDASLVLLDRTHLDLATLRGRVVVLNLFATWCEPCRDELPLLVSFAGAHAREATVIGVDIAEDNRLVAAFRDEHAIPYTIAIDPANALHDTIGMESYPTTLFIRPDGRLSCAWIGELNAVELEREYRTAAGA